MNRARADLNRWFALFGNVIAVACVAAMVDWVVAGYLQQRPATLVGQYPSWLALVGVCRAAAIWGEQYLQRYSRRTSIGWARGLSVFLSLVWFLLPIATYLVWQWRHGAAPPSPPPPTPPSQGSAVLAGLAGLGGFFVITLVFYLILYPLFLFVIRPSTVGGGQPAPSLLTVTPLRSDLPPLVGHGVVVAALAVFSASFVPQKGYSSAENVVFWTLLYSVLRLPVFFFERAIYNYRRAALVRIGRVIAVGCTAAALVVIGAAASGSSGFGNASSTSGAPIDETGFLNIIGLLVFLYSLLHVGGAFVSFLIARARGPAPFEPELRVERDRDAIHEPEATLWADWMGAALSLGSLGMVFFLADSRSVLIGLGGGVILAIGLIVYEHGRTRSIYSYVRHNIYSLIGVPLGGVDLVVAFTQSSDDYRKIGLACTAVALLVLPPLRSFLARLEVVRAIASVPTP